MLTFELNLVSVIIPTYNRSKQVLVAINSVLNQTYSQIEVVVVDDGSTDDTEQVLAAFGDRIRYLKKKNGGVSSARNYGIHHSTGDLIAFLDSDDLFLPHKIEKQVAYLAEHPDFGMVLSDCYYINPQDQRIGQSNRREHLPNDGAILESVLLHPSLIPSSALIRKSLLIQVGCFDESLKTAEDLKLHIQLASVTKIGLISQPLLEISRGGEGLSMLSCTYDDHVFVYEQFARDHRSEVSTLVLKKAFLNVYASATQGKFWMHEWKQAIKYGVKMLAYTSSDNVIRVLKIWLGGTYAFAQFIFGKKGK